MSKDPKLLKAYPFGLAGIWTSSEDASIEILGGKGYSLWAMSMLDYPVPAGFTLPTSMCHPYLCGEVLPWDIAPLTTSGLEALTQKFGYLPLLSVRSGAQVSLPGMCDTILNVGMTNDTLGFWSEKIGTWAALDSYRRLIQMLSSVAMNIPLERFQYILEGIKAHQGVTLDSELSESSLVQVVDQYLALLSSLKITFPQTVEDQLGVAIGSVFRSWNNERAIEYRKVSNIPESLGTAVTIQAMVFGNMNSQSCSGVLFTRNTNTGAVGLVGEYLPNAQGEDVVAGIRTPLQIASMEDWNVKCYIRLATLAYELEKRFKDVQDIEFTVQDGELYLLQTRTAKRTAKAAFTIALDMVHEGLITKEEALARLTKDQYHALSSVTVDSTYTQPPTAIGLPASSGVAKGLVVFTSQRAVEESAKGNKVVLLTKETSPDDFAGMIASEGIITTTGGLTAHAAVVARGFNKVCVVGVKGLELDAGIWFADGNTLPELTPIVVDGTTGRVWVAEDVPVTSGGGGIVLEVMEDWFTEGSVVFLPEPVTPNSYVRLPTTATLFEIEDYLLHLPTDIRYMLDLRVEYDLLKPAEIALHNAFGTKAVSNDGYMVAEVLLALSDTLSSCAALVLPDTYSKQAEMDLAAAGYTITQTCLCLEDLVLLGKGEAIVIPDHLNNSVIARLVQLISLAGVGATIIHNPKHKSRKLYLSLQG